MIPPLEQLSLPRSGIVRHARANEWHAFSSLEDEILDQMAPRGYKIMTTPNEALRTILLIAGWGDTQAAEQVELEVPVGSTPTSVMASLHLPIKLCALVMLNGVFVRAADRATQRLVEGDVLAIWPPIAGG
jgi:sulfur carrier protein ThiS